MGKKEDPKVPILPSRTRQGTALRTSDKLDSPSVMSKFDSPQLHATSAESGNMSGTFDGASTTFDTTGSLGSFIEEHIAATARFSGVGIPVTRTPIGKLMVILILLALRRDSLRMIILCLMMIYAGNLMNVLIPTLLL